MGDTRLQSRAGCTDKQELTGLYFAPVAYKKSSNPDSRLADALDNLA